MKKKNCNDLINTRLNFYFEIRFGLYPKNLYFHIYTDSYLNLVYDSGAISFRNLRTLDGEL